MRQIYSEIEKGFPKYSDTIKIKDATISTDWEPFVEIPQKFNTKLKYKKPIIVRMSVHDKFLCAQERLKSLDNTLSLCLFEGYRSLKKQKSLFKQALDRANGDIELAHSQIAHPDVAGHPTGGAIDVAIWSEGQILNFGTGYCDWDCPPRKHYFASPEITGQQRKNRELLRDLIIEQGFTQFAGEWWHFSYGDKDWAFLTNTSTALYNQKDI